MNLQEIKQLTCKKHIKIYKLSVLGLSKSEIAKELGTNYGHVYNVLKKYSTDESLKAKAELVEN